MPYGLENCVIVPDTVKIKFDIKIESTDKNKKNNIDRALAKKKGSMLKSKNTINNSDIYDLQLFLLVWKKYAISKWFTDLSQWNRRSGCNNNTHKQREFSQNNDLIAQT